MCVQATRTTLDPADAEVHRTGCLAAGVDRNDDFEQAGGGHVLVQDDGGPRRGAGAPAPGSGGYKSVRRGGYDGHEEYKRSEESQLRSPRLHTSWIGPNLEPCNETCAGWTRV